MVEGVRHRFMGGVRRRGVAPAVRQEGGEQEERVGKDAAKLGDPALGRATGAREGGGGYR